MAKVELQGIMHWATGTTVSKLDWQEVRDSELDRLADCIDAHINVSLLLD